MCILKASSVHVWLNTPKNTSKQVWPTLGGPCFLIYLTDVEILPAMAADSAGTWLPVADQPSPGTALPVLSQLLPLHD